MILGKAYIYQILKVHKSSFAWWFQNYNMQFQEKKNMKNIQLAPCALE